ncbi:NAD(P)-dependent dehydrogenase (short-subunit alcohol dehydrogenase family) [Rhodococcus opacus]|nr:NAD(P)-dependent dehydrogenase (short-subunit alcohol dehydrogenase family) [Rhodococcus opacus]
MIDVNLSGVWRTVRVGAPYIVDGGRGGSIVISSSLAAMMPNGNIAYYAAAKAGLIGLMRVLAKERAPHSIRVNTHDSSDHSGDGNGAQRRDAQAVST